MDEVLEQVREVGDELTQIRDTATLLAAHLRLKEAKARYVSSLLGFDLVQDSIVVVFLNYHQRIKYTKVQHNVDAD